MLVEVVYYATIKTSAIWSLKDSKSAINASLLTGWLSSRKPIGCY